MDWTQFDLNLLRTLLVLLQEKNTRKAADRLGVSQPAVSRSLARIRACFDDPLFIRQARGLALTDRGVELAEQLPEIMEALQASLQGKQFEPEKLTGKFRLAMNSYLSESHGYLVCQAIMAQAPNVELELHNYTPSTQMQLQRQILDAAISFYPLDLSKEIRQQVVSTTNVGALCRKDHPLESKFFEPMDLANYPVAGLILPEFNEQQMLIQKLLGKSFVLQPKFRSQQLATILQYVSDSDGLCIAPKSSFCGKLPDDYRFLELSHEGHTVEMPIALAFHNNKYRTAKFNWLAQLVEGVFSA
ncbi:LysR family transcriptional regulator [Neiella marina]|uniref:LysR family transcriptional regulator n=1 Tax=Neiella holothuriorum TaxID=2870530 RepID=A0ABS7EIP9_9GAMM|nr:LysR family transcriptional regulator [Neiella holothuriorum]MBW8192214.1 LysR family transcriptional regulator [Neiella holothuriorum]